MSNFQPSWAKPAAEGKLVTLKEFVTVFWEISKPCNYLPLRCLLLFFNMHFFSLFLKPFEGFEVFFCFSLTCFSWICMHFFGPDAGLCWFRSSRNIHTVRAFSFFPSSLPSILKVLKYIISSPTFLSVNHMQCSWWKLCYHLQSYSDSYTRKQL